MLIIVRDESNAEPPKASGARRRVHGVVRASVAARSLPSW